MGQTARMVQARHATKADIDALGIALAAAFATDPVWGWMVPDQARWSRWAADAFAHDADVRLRQGHVYTVDGAVGAAMWAPPGLWRGSLLDQAREAPSMVRLIGRAGLRRGVAMLRGMEKAHPRDDHWYLGLLGTDPAHQGRGIGSALLRPILDRCDLDGVGAYLESSNPANVPFYERHGFRVTGQLSPGGSPPLDQMWRDPQVPGSTSP